MTLAIPPENCPSAPGGENMLTAHESQAPRVRLGAVVAAREQLGATRVRLTFSGADVADFIRTTAAQAPSAWVKLFVTNAGCESVGRAYTVRQFDLVKGTFDVDFVLHESGPLSTWARTSKAGDLVEFVGPRNGGFNLHPESRWIVLIGDESALPAMQAILADLPVDFPGIVLIESDHSDDYEAFFVGPNIRLKRVRQACGKMVATDQLVRALDCQMILPGPGQAWVAGEAGSVMAVRALLQEKWNLGRTDICARGYWKYGVVHFRP